MKRLILLGVICSVTSTAIAADQVRGYVRRDGTYVAPHYRSSPDGNPHNNYSTRGNVNPYTGESGTVDPYRIPTPQIPQYQNPYSNPYSNPYGR